MALENPTNSFGLLYPLFIPFKLTDYALLLDLLFVAINGLHLLETADRFLLLA
jgi:hypothetical protein